MSTTIVAHQDQERQSPRPAAVSVIPASASASVAIARAVRRRGWRLLPLRLGRKTGAEPLGLLSVCPACETRSLWIFPLGPLDRLLWACLDGCAKARVLDALGVEEPELRARLVALPERENGELREWRARYGRAFVIEEPE